MTTSNPTPDANSDILPSETVRGIVTFILIVHFLALTVALAYNPGMVAGRPAPLVAQLHNTLYRDYLWNLWLDLPYDFSLTSGGAPDIGAVAVVEYSKNDELVKVILPDPAHASEPRQRALQQLLNLIAESPPESSQAERIMVLAGKDILQEKGAQRATIECRYPRDDLPLQSLQELLKTAPADRNVDGPNWQGTYRSMIIGQIKIEPDGSPTYVTLSGRAESAPVARPANQTLPLPPPKPPLDDSRGTPLPPPKPPLDDSRGTSIP